MKRGNDILIITSNQVKKKIVDSGISTSVIVFFFFSFFQQLLFRCLHVKVKQKETEKNVPHMFISLVFYEFNTVNEYFLYVKNENENMDSNIFSWWFMSFHSNQKRPSFYRQVITAGYSNYLIHLRVWLLWGEERCLWLWGELVMGFWTILWTSINARH